MRIIVEAGEPQILVALFVFGGAMSRVMFFPIAEFMPVLEYSGAVVEYELASLPSWRGNMPTAIIDSVQASGIRSPSGLANAGFHIYRNAIDHHEPYRYNRDDYPVDLASGDSALLCRAELQRDPLSHHTNHMPTGLPVVKAHK